MAETDEKYIKFVLIHALNNLETGDSSWQSAKMFIAGLAFGLILAKIGGPVGLVIALATGLHIFAGEFRSVYAALEMYSSTDGGVLAQMISDLVGSRNHRHFVEWFKDLDNQQKLKNLLIGYSREEYGRRGDNYFYYLF